MEGEGNARKAYDSAAAAFGTQSGLAGGTALTLADCLIGLGRLVEASKYLANVDVKAVSQLTGDPDAGGGIILAQAEIAAKQRDYVHAKLFLDSVRAVFSRPDTEPYQKRKLEEISAMIGSRS